MQRGAVGAISLLLTGVRVEEVGLDFDALGFIIPGSGARVGMVVKGMQSSATGKWGCFVRA